MKMVLDIVFTAIEGCGCLYIVKDEEIKENRQVRCRKKLICFRLCILF